MSESRVLVLYAHAKPHRSNVNQRMATAARTLPNVWVQELYETYPDFYIDVPTERALLEEADLVVFQHPVQWYGMPALLKEWVDMVLGYDWAYGPSGNALAGKDFWLAATAGGTEESYSAQGQHGQSLESLLAPVQQMARLCGMRWVPPLMLYGAQQADDAAVAAHVETYRARLASFPEGSR